jgi:hypothetical protein
MIRMHCWVAAWVVLVAGCSTTSSAAGKSADLLVQFVPSAPPGCTKIGDIQGSDEAEPQMTPSREAAKADAVQQARKKGATHVVQTFAGRCGRNTECYDVTAYRCPAQASPAPDARLAAPPSVPTIPVRMCAAGAACQQRSRGPWRPGHLPIVST